MIVRVVETRRSYCGHAVSASRWLHAMPKHAMRGVRLQSMNTRAMNGLDLSARPPRPCREELGGISFLPRAIDKVRASLPGGTMGAYINTSDGMVTMSALFYRTMDVTHDDFVSAVTDAPDEAAVLVWLRARIDDERIAKWNARLLKVRLSDVPAEARAFVTAIYPVSASFPPEALMVDVIDRDDAETFTKLA